MGLDFLPDDDSRAVSPVIGVIIMLAITVILGAVIATFALDFGDDLDSSAPTTSFDYDLDVQNGELTVTVQEGDPVDPNAVRIVGSNFPSESITTGDEPFLSSADGNAVDLQGNSDEVNIGQSFTVDLTYGATAGATGTNSDFTGEETVEFIFDGGGGGEQRTVLDTYELIEFSTN